MNITSLGEARFASPIQHPVSDKERIPANIAMAGKTGLVIGFLHDSFIHIPIEMLVREKKHINTDGVWWKAVLAATGQPARFQ